MRSATPLRATSSSASATAGGHGSSPTTRAFGHVRQKATDSAPTPEPTSQIVAPSHPSASWRPSSVGTTESMTPAMKADIRPRLSITLGSSTDQPGERSGSASMSPASSRNARAAVATIARSCGDSVSMSIPSSATTPSSAAATAGSSTTPSTSAWSFAPSAASASAPALSRITAPIVSSNVIGRQPTHG